MIRSVYRFAWVGVDLIKFIRPLIDVSVSAFDLAYLVATALGTILRIALEKLIFYAFWYKNCENKKNFYIAAQSKGYCITSQGGWLKSPANSVY